MYLLTAEAIMSRDNDLRESDQPFLFKTADDIIHLAPAIEKEAHTPVGARNHLAHYPQFRHNIKHGTHHQFDPETYEGMDFLEPLLKDVWSSPKGASYWQKRLLP